MSAESQPTPPRPTLEDLLRFKRAERPSPEFWAEFDRGLRQKQLAALMKQPKGWSRWRPVVGQSVRWAVPATAAAAVALVVVQLPWSSGSGQQPAEVASRVLSQNTEKHNQTATPRVAAVALANHDSASVQGMPAANVASADRAVVEAASREEPSLISWSSAAFDRAATFRDTPVSFVANPAAQEKRSRSSWTSHFSEIAQNMAAQGGDAYLQLASMDLSSPEPESQKTADTYAAGSQAMRHSVDRDFRDLESRFGVTGSSLSIKF